jgi:endonuclease-8
LRRDAKPERAWDRISRSKTSIAALLMDQAVLAGVGNVYRAEVLFRHGVAPRTPGRALDRELWDAMWADLVTLMRAGVRVGRIDTVRPEHLPEAMGRAARVDRHGGEVYVYRRAGEPCLVCGTPVATSELVEAQSQNQKHFLERENWLGAPEQTVGMDAAGGDQGYARR